MHRFTRGMLCAAAQRGARFAAATAVTVAATSPARPAQMAELSNGSDPEVPEWMRALPIPPEAVAPLVAQTSFGSVVGFCSGFALKRVGKAAAFTIGLGFAAVQALSYSGYVQVQWDQVQRDVVRVLDADGDGKLTEKDVTAHWNSAMEVLQFEVPSASGFVVGFLLGLRT